MIAETFEPTEITYKKFITTIDSVEAVIVSSTRNMVNALKVKADEGQINKTLADFTAVNSKMDKLMLELFALSANGEGDINTGALEELQKLIDSVKWYK